MKKNRLKKLHLLKSATMRQVFRQSLVFVLVCVLQMGVYAVTPQEKVSLNVRDMALREVLKLVKNQTGVKFVYSDVEIQKGKPVTVQFSGQPLKTALERVLDGQPFVFEIEDDVVIIKPLKQQRISSPPVRRTITGTVLDAETGMPLPGANVFDSRTHKGTVTDVNGEFSLQIPEECNELTISFVGYEMVKANVQGKTELKIRLKEEAKTMDEVVVTGIQTIEKGRATGAFALLKQEDMKSIYSTSLSEKLEGQVSGLYLDKNNEITIRGISTLNANTKPLIVVDGFPMESSELNLNPNDIEQISVLKDAASASIWGIRAANGVVVVTTKRGSKNNGFNVSYSGNVTYGSKVDLDDLHILSSDEYVRLKFANILAQGVTENAYTGYTELEKIYLKYKHGDIALNRAQAEVDELGKFNNQKQLEDNFYRHSFTQQHNIAIQTGGERSFTYLSLSYDQNKSQLVGNEYNKYNLLINNDINLRKNLSLAVNVRATHQYSKRNGTDVSGYEPWKKVLNDDGSYYKEYNGVSEAWQAGCEALGMKNWDKNSLRDMRMNDKKTKAYNVSSSLKLAWKPMEGLELSSQGNYEFGKTEAIDVYSEDHYFTRDLTNRFTQIQAENGAPKSVVKYNLPTSGGIKDIANDHLISYSVRNIISYNGEQGEFGYKVVAGNEFYSLEGTKFSDRLWGYNPELLTSQSINLTELQGGVKGYTGTSSKQTLTYAPAIGETLERYTSYFGTASVTYKDRYDLFGSIRLDQTNLLTNSSEFRNNPSWSVGAKWNIAREDFFKSEKINDLGVRLSYGLTGNIDKTTGPDIVAVAKKDFFISSLNYLDVTNPANPELGWERTYNLNAGVDAVVWDGRLSVNADFYSKKSRKLLATVEVDPTVGWNSVFKNSAEVVNRGIDLTLYGRILANHAVKWDATLQFSYNKNKVTSLNYTPSRSSAYSGSPIKGHPIGYIAAHRYGGLDEKGEPTFLLPGDDTPHSYKELSTLTIDDLKFMGRTTPPVFGSLSSNISYHDFTLGFMVTYKLGHKMRLPSPIPMMFGLMTEWYSEKYRWVEGQDNRDKWVPYHEAQKYQDDDRTNCLIVSDKMVDKADIIHLKSVSLEYNATRLLNKISLKGGAIRVSGENLTYWAANRCNINPDQVSTDTFDGTTLSLDIKPRVVFSLNLNF